MTQVLTTIFGIVVGIECITLLLMLILSSLYSLSTDVNIEKRRAEQDKRDKEYHEARMKTLLK